VKLNWKPVDCSCPPIFQDPVAPESILAFIYMIDNLNGMQRVAQVLVHVNRKQ